MIRRKQIELLDRLYESTSAGRLEWGIAVEENSYQTSFPRFTLILQRRDHDPEEFVTPSFTLKIYNDEGMMIDQIALPEFDEDGGETAESERLRKRLQIIHNRAKENTVDIYLDKLIEAMA